MKQSLKSGFIVLTAVVVIALATGITSLVKAKRNANYENYNSSSYSTQKTGSRSKEYIAALYIEGTITESSAEYDQKWLMSNILKLVDDKKNKAIAIYINSPGGAVYQTDEVYLLLQEYKKTGRKVYVYQGPMAASGGYYISCAGDKIYANRNTLTGSIGVLFGGSLDLTGLMERYGIKSETIHAGKNKNLGNYNEPFTDEQRQIMQSIADECYNQFTEVVAYGRNLSIENVRKLADGRIFSANQALNAGLIDQIGSWDDMIRDLRENELNKPNINIINIKKEKKKDFWNYLLTESSRISERKASISTGIPEIILNDINSGFSGPAYLYK